MSDNDLGKSPRYFRRRIDNSRSGNEECHLPSMVNIGASMVFVFFCVSGVLGPMRRHPSLTTREGEPETIRSLDSDVLRMAGLLSRYPGAVVVVGNDWPFYYDVRVIRLTCRELGLPVVNVVKTFGGAKENAVVDFMSSRTEPFVIVASQDFEFSENTASQRINLNHQGGFDETASTALSEHLSGLGDHSRTPLSDDDMRRAAIVRYATHRARSYLSNIRVSVDA